MSLRLALICLRILWKVDYDGNPDTLKQISDAVSKAGYEATPRSDKKDSAATTKADATDSFRKGGKAKED